MPTETGTLADYFIPRKRPGETGLPVLSVTMNDGLVPRASLDRRTESAMEAKAHSLVEPGDIAYNMMRMWQGASGLCRVRANISPAYVVMTPKANTEPAFAAHWLKSKDAIDLLWAYSHGLTEDRLRLYPDDFLSIPATFPALEDQRRIAAVLDAWDYAIATVERLIGQRQQLHGKLLRDLYVPCIDLSVMRLGWENCTISDLAEVAGGGTPPTGTPAYWGGDINWCTPTDLTALPSRWVERTERTITNAGLSASAATLLPTRSVILCSRASVGECAINLAPMATNQGFQSLVPHESRDAEFLLYLVKAIKKRLIRIAAGSTFLEFGRNELRKLEIQVPGPAERLRIGNVMSLVDDGIDQERQRLAALRNQKHGLMQLLLTGKLRVPETTDSLLPPAPEFVAAA